MSNPNVAKQPKPIRVGSINGVWTFVESLDWEEPWLWGLVGFHALCIVFTIGALLTRSFNIQAGFFLFYLLLAYCAQYINEWAAANYKLFSAQQYFDSQGMFISLLFSTPLILNSFVIVVLWVWDTGKTMIGLKRTKLKHRARQLQKQQEAQEAIPEKSDDTDSPSPDAQKTDSESCDAKETEPIESLSEEPVQTEDTETKKDK